MSVETKRSLVPQGSLLKSVTNLSTSISGTVRGSISNKNEILESAPEEDKIFINKPGLTAEDIYKSTCLLDSWFIRASWSYKKEFLFQCLNRFHVDELEQIMLYLGPPCKCYFYSTSEYTNYSCDITPIDDNRQMQREALNKARDSDLQWILTLPKQQALNIVMGLVELSGNSIQMQLYNRAKYLLDQIQNDNASKINLDKTEGVDTIDKPSLPEDKQNKTKVLNNIDHPGLPEETNNNRKEFEDYRLCQDEYQKYIEMLKAEINDIKEPQSKKLSKAGKKKNKKIVKEIDSQSDVQGNIDYIQLLPSWIVHNIFSYLNKETLFKCQNVNSYWKNSIIEYLKEMDSRLKIDIAASNIKLDIDGNTPTKNNKRRTTILKTATSNTKRASSKSPERISQVSSKIKAADSCDEDLISYNNKFKTSSERLALRNKYLLVWTIDEHVDSRITAVGKRWMAFSRDDQIVLCNLMTLADMPGNLEAHKGGITALAFHPEDSYLLSAGEDNILKKWEVWGRQEVLKIDLPSVKSITANNKYYLVGAESIKLFRWETNVCEWTIENNQISITSISANNCIYTTYLPDNTIRRLSPKNGAVLEEVPRAHCADITSLYQNGPYFVTASNDGWVYLWKSNLPNIIALASRNFQKKITDVILHEGCILASNDEGEIYIWDTVEDKIVKICLINDDTMPIINMHMINYDDHCKIIVNTEMGMKVIQFNYNRGNKKTNEKILTKTCRNLKQELNNSDEKVITFRNTNGEDSYKKEAKMRQTCHPDMRKDLKKFLTIREATDNLTRSELKDLRYFPAQYYNSKHLITRKEQMKEIARDEFIAIPYKTPKPTINLRNYLPMHNPFKHQF